MLLQLRDFIQREHVVSTQQLARAFQVDEHALEPMLAIWVQKGVIVQVQDKQSCKNPCSRCKTNQPIFYRYTRK